jgi:hypothetical protein
MKRSSFILVGIVLLIITVIVCTVVLHDNQKKIMDSQKSILDKMKDKSFDMITGRNPIGFKASKVA